MTDKEIIKGLECCLDTSPFNCIDCPMFNATNSTMVCSKIVTKFALDLINRQQKEVERLKAEEEKYPFKCVMPFNSMICSKSIEDYDRLVGDIWADAIKEFAERLCEGRLSNDPIVIAVKCELKEMVG